MRKRIYQIIELAERNDFTSRIYDIFMMLVILTSLIPLAFKEQTPAFQLLDRITVTIFIIDYILRLLTADMKLEGKGIKAFVIGYVDFLILT